MRASADLVAVGAVHGPEEVAIDQDGKLVAGAHDGEIVKVSGEREETFAETGGRPLGLAWDASGALIVADAIHGLLSVSETGEITALTTSSHGVPFKFTDDVDVAHDARVTPRQRHRGGKTECGARARPSRSGSLFD
jgi:sugar lactone lactonase YvrE